MKLDQLRKIIREEVRSAMQGELKDIITEAVKIASEPTTKPSVKVPKVEPKRQKSFSELVNEDRQLPQNPQFETKGNPVLEALNETAASGAWRNINGGTFNAQDAVGWSGGGPMAGAATPVVSSVDQMIQGKRASDITQVSIDAVPDFSGLMNNLKEKGKL